MKMSTKCLLVMLVAVFAVPGAFADLYYETKVTGMPGSDGDDIMKTYMSESGTRVEPGDNTAVIVNIKDEVFVEMNLEKKTYKETKFSDFMKPTSQEESDIADQMGKMMEQMLGSMTVQETDETQKINGYDCKKYIVSIMGSESDYWLTKDVKGYDAMVKRMDDFRDVFRKHPVLNGIAAGYDMMKKMDGFPIKIVNKMMGMELVSEVITVETKKLDADLFKAPKDFTRES